MTGDGILKTDTDTITAHTASDHHGVGAGTTVPTIPHTIVPTTVLTGAAGATVHGDTTGTTTLGITEDTMIHGITEDITDIMTHGIMEATTEDITEATTEDITEDITEDTTPVTGDGTTLGTTITIITAGMTLTTTVLHTSEAPPITRTDITA